MPDENPFETPSATEPTDAGQTVPEVPAADGTVNADATPPSAATAELPPLTAERAVDIFLGGVAIAAEATGKKVKQLSEQARTLRDDAPEILDSFEQRGRPLREQIVGKLREGFAPIPDEGDEAGNGGGRTAEQDIQALEQRVRELEAEVTPTSEAPSAMPVLAPSDSVGSSASLAETSEPTPAEEATFVPHPDLDFSLADSSYAVSETDEEAEKESEPQPTKAETDLLDYGSE